MKTSKRTVLTTILTIIVAVVAGLVSFTITDWFLNPDSSNGAAPGTSRVFTLNENLEPLKYSEALAKSEIVAKEKFPNSQLIIFGDDEGASSLYLGSTEIKTHNTTSSAKQWIFGYLKDNTKSYTATASDRIDVPANDMFVVQVNSSQALITRERYYGDIKVSNIQDISARVSDVILEESMAKIKESFTPKIQAYGYTEDDLIGVNIAANYTYYLNFGIGNDPIIEPIVNIEFSYPNGDSTREFSADYFVDSKVIESSRIYPE